MKKWITLFITISMLFCLSACRGDPPTIASAYTVSFTVTQDAIRYEGTLQQNDEAMTVTLSEPYAVSGMSFVYSGEELQIDYAGHSTIANSDYISSLTIPAVLHNSLSYAHNAEYQQTDESIDRFSLPTPYGSAELCACDGIPTSLYDEHSGLEFSFQLP